MNDYYDRFQQLKKQDSYAEKRELYLQNYNRRNWLRNKGKKNEATDPNFGSFKAKIDKAIGVFIGVMIERPMWVKCVPTNAPLDQQKRIKDRISSAFHRHFIKPWENRFIEDVLSVFDMVMYGKGIDYWPNVGCFYSKNVPVEHVFPDTNAGMNPEDWGYCYVIEQYTYEELDSILEDETRISEEGWNAAYLKEIISEGSSQQEDDIHTESEVQLTGDKGTAERDEIYRFAVLYIKEDYSDDNPISKYMFATKVKEYDERDKDQQKGMGTVKVPAVKCLIEKKNYCKCHTQVLAVRSYQITRSYWKFDSFARQIYLSTAVYDKCMSLILRSAKRNMIQFWQTDSPTEANKLRKITDDEVQIINPEVKLLQNQNRVETRELHEVVRSIVQDTENDNALAQSPGSQNVKGYAITAEEAGIRAAKEGEAESLNIKMLMRNDTRWYKELYRRGVKIGTSDKIKNANKMFKAEMEQFGIEPKYYDIDNLYFDPAYDNAASQSVRIQRAQALLGALSFKPSSPAEEKGQMNAIAAIIGADNVDDYLGMIPEIDPVISKAGAENEDLDNPSLNPANVPVLPEDKHMQEIPIHMADYEFKLGLAEKMIQQASAIPNPALSVVLTNAAYELIRAQDNKGGHINAHIQKASNTPEGAKAVSQLTGKYKELQSRQDQMMSQVEQLMTQLNSSLNQDSMRDQEFMHKKRMYDLDYEQSTRMGEFKEGVAVGKAQDAEQQRARKAAYDTDSKATTLAAQEESARLDLERKQEELNQKKNKENEKQPEPGSS